MCRVPVIGRSTPRALRSTARCTARPTRACPSGIYVAADSALTRQEDLAGVAVGVGYHSGSHYSALQAVEAFMARDQVTLSFVGCPRSGAAAAARRNRRGQCVGCSGLSPKAAGVPQADRYDFRHGLPLVRPRPTVKMSNGTSGCCCAPSRRSTWSRSATPDTGPAKCLPIWSSSSTSVVSVPENASCLSPTRERCSSAPRVG